MRSDVARVSGKESPGFSHGGERQKKTGWPVKPSVSCCKPLTAARVLCHLALERVDACTYTPMTCPFYGHYPDLSKNVPEKKNPAQMSLMEGNDATATEIIP